MPARPAESYRDHEMKLKVLSLLGLAFILLLPSCLEYETTLTLNQDGSGTITEEVMLTPQVLGMLGLGAPQGGDNPLDAWKKEENVQKKAASYGKGVTLVKAEDLKGKDGAKGLRLIYNFRDINDVTWNPSGNLDSMMSFQADDLEFESKEQEVVTFLFKNGRLIVQLPNPEKDEQIEDVEGIDPDGPMVAEMKKQMKGMKMSAKIVIADGIAKTTASHHKDKTISLYELDMDEMMKKPGNFEKVIKLGPLKPGDHAEALKDIDGIKAETEKEIVVILK